MKNIFLFMLLVGCTQKYADYDLIRKVDFNRETFDRPVTVYQIMAQGQDQISECFNQWLFFSNAEKEKEREVSSLVRLLCPHKDYLVNAQFTDTWWTTLIFSQSCVSIKTTCGELKKEKVDRN